ncbi:MAG: hypothetical protein ACNJA3_19270 [Pseudomonas rhizophila]|jgi:hypothetical protein|uniref:hypothetical protein n=1 Tax=Pseudomonas TaxID=286 RepID=UPI00064047BD|nr:MULTISPECIES: hypothetical protein [Pseudomonas]MEA1028670.1 hypothetical protein [Pseudomonas sp. N-137]WNZ76929.1 hypothetical protein QOM08_19710 [Pseudomonas sp. P105]
MQDGYWPFHLFGATFVSDAEAQQYVFEQWESEPPESATEAEYSAWEDRNPTWRLAEELEFHMDPDFVEFPGSLEDVITKIRCPEERALVSSKAAEFTHFIMVGLDAIWGDRRSSSTQVEPVVRLPESTVAITYLGKFN